MNLKKQQLIAISLAFCCAAVMPLQAEARKKENKTNETQPVVSSVPQPRSQKQVLIQNTPTESRRITTPNQSKVQVRTIAAAPQLTAKEAKKAAADLCAEDAAGGPVGHGGRSRRDPPLAGLRPARAGEPGRSRARSGRGGAHRRHAVGAGPGAVGRPHRPARHAGGL